MKRRDIIMTGAAVAATQAVVAATGCKAEGGTTAAAVQPGDDRSALAAALEPCLTQGEVCLTHCLRLLSGGDPSLGACAARVREMLAVCTALQTLVASETSFLPQAAALCVEVCDTCRAECAKHAKHHRECRDCETACVGVIAAARRVAAA